MIYVALNYNKKFILAGRLKKMYYDEKLKAIGKVVNSACMQLLQSFIFWTSKIPSSKRDTFGTYSRIINTLFSFR